MSGGVIKERRICGMLLRQVAHFTAPVEWSGIRQVTTGTPAEYAHTFASGCKQHY